MTWIYNSPLAYEMMMRLLYGRYFEARYRAVAAQIPDGAEVLDVCCGDFRIYRKYLRKKQVQYFGIDASAEFEKFSKKHGVSFKKEDLRRTLLPKTDYVLMMSSLYQFYDEKEQMLERLLDCARKKLIITEPIRNLSESSCQIISRLAKQATGASVRFQEVEFERLVRAKAEFYCGMERIDGGRELMAIFEKR